MAGDHGNVHMVNSKQLRETKIEDAKSRGKIVSISLCLSPSLSLWIQFTTPWFCVCFLARKQTCGEKKKKKKKSRCSSSSNHCLLLILFLHLVHTKITNFCPQIVVDFTATWCGLCRLMTPVFSELIKKYDILTFLEVDVDKSRWDSSSSSIPTITDKRSHCLANSDLNPLHHSLLLPSVFFFFFFFYFLEPLWFCTLWHEEGDDFAFSIFWSALPQGASDQRKPNASQMCASHSHMLNLHGLPPLLPPSSVFARCIRSRESNASQTCASDSHIMLFDSAWSPPPSSVFCKVHQNQMLLSNMCIQFSHVVCFCKVCLSHYSGGRMWISLNCPCIKVP